MEVPIFKVHIFPHHSVDPQYSEGILALSISIVHLRLAPHDHYSFAMVVLKRLKLASTCTQQSSLVVLDPNTTIAAGSCGESNPETNLDEDATSRSLASLRQFIKPASWLVTSTKTEPCKDSGVCFSTAQPESPTQTAKAKAKPTKFHDLPTEIHFRIATYLPDHALHIVAKYGYSERIRRVYQAADPRSVRLDIRRLSFEERSIYNELYMRDNFEATPLPRPMSSPYYRGIWASTMFHCWGCHESVGCAHFPLKEMEESRERRTGMSKITERQCFARITPVELWDKRVTTWDELQQAWHDMDDDAISSTILSDHVLDRQKSGKTKSRTKPDRHTDIPNTLKLTNLDFAATLSHMSARHLGVEATAEYYIDLYPLFRLLVTDGPSVRAYIAQKRPYMCPHLDLVALMSRPMSTNPIDFRPNNPSYAAHATVADVLCKALEAAPWHADPDAPYRRRRDEPQRRIKEQTIWCGFKGNKCRTAVSLQRFRDSSRENSVGGLWGLSDLCRIKVVRKWRVDCGTGEEEWRAQNGVSVPAASRRL